jgi:hypothetical protein
MLVAMNPRNTAHIVRDEPMNISQVFLGKHDRMPPRRHPGKGCQHDRMAFFDELLDGAHDGRAVNDGVLRSGLDEPRRHYVSNF